MTATNRKPASISKPFLGAEALRFAVEPTERTGEGDTKVRGKKITPRASKAVSGLVPQGDVRLTANIRGDLHLKLKIEAANRRTSIGELLEELIEAL
jgi:hypothetical protein